MTLDIAAHIANALKIKPNQVTATIDLINEGATIPFIARYRKEATEGLSDDTLRALSEQYSYLTELQARKETVLNSIEEQGKLTPELKSVILAADNKTRLEDLYLPFKPKRRTKAQIAKEAGLDPLAATLLKDQGVDANIIAEQYIDPTKSIHSISDALDGAKHIIAESLTENADLIEILRTHFYDNGIIASSCAPNKETEGEKFKDYFEFSEALTKIPSHRILAIFRGRKEQILRVKLDFSDESALEKCYELIGKSIHLDKQTASAWLWETITWSWRIKLTIKLETEIMVNLKNRADEEAIRVFADNLKHLLMAAPAGDFVVLGLDPGFRTGVKTVIVDQTGKLLNYTVIYPHAPQKQWDRALATLAKLCGEFKVKLISIGNGTASRETDALASELIKKHPELALQKIVVSEAGASVYSASPLASKEFPDLDVSYRGAVSIARRLQDPLAELVKIDPKSIGVGQYQHDVNQIKLSRSLQACVEDCVNAVGADINTASVPLLTSISGLNESTASNIVSFREQNGKFKNRDMIKQVPRLGEKTFEQAAGFLRIIQGENPLDASAVHPESYAIVQRIAEKLDKPIADLIGNSTLIDTLNPLDFVTEQAGLPTIKDILSELKKPGRDPRPTFKMAQFSDGINEISDLKPGMKLEGVITNVANFGAFVDIGVHQDGLVHVSQIADHFVSDVHKVVSVGKIVSVTVLDVEANRKRISLSMKTNPTEHSNKPQAKAKPKNTKPLRQPKKQPSEFGSQLKDAFMKAKK